MTNTRELAHAAEAYGNAVDYLHGPRRRAARDGFISGAEWLAERSVDRNEFDAMRQDRDDFKSQASDLQAKLDAMTGERDGWQNSATDFAQKLHDERSERVVVDRQMLGNRNHIVMLQADNARLEKERDMARNATDEWITLAEKRKAEAQDWHHAYDRLVSDVVHGRKHVLPVTVGVDPAAPGSDRTVIAVCKAYERAMDDMHAFGLGVVSIDGDSALRHVDLKEFLADKLDSKDDAGNWRT